MPIHHLQADEIATPKVFDYAYDLAEESGIVDLIEAEVAAHVRGSGRPRTGLAYSIRAVLVAMAMLTYRGRPVTNADIVRTILDLTREQLDAVDMTLTAQQVADVRWGVIDARREYGRFHGWWDRTTAVLEPNWDLPRRRITVEAFKEVMDRRTDEDWTRSRRRWEILQQICNMLLRASIDTITPMPGATYGIDETTLMAAAPDRELGTQPGKKRCAMPAASYFTRDRGVVVEHADGSKTRGGDKRGIGIGVTAMSRFGPRHNLLASPPVFTSVEFGPVTSGDPARALGAIDRAQAAGLALPGSKGRRPPLLALDMGYSIKKGLNAGLLERGYSANFHYREGWQGVSMSPSVLSPSRGREDTGPVHAWGGHYCPAVAHLLGENLVARTDDMKDPEHWDRHDARLRQILPARMGVNGRPKVRRCGTGRPVTGIDAPTEWRQTLICPAVQGRVQCPLKPDSMRSLSDGDRQPDGRPWGPEMRPTWEADRYLCCRNSQVTVPMTEQQVRNHQPGLQAGSWEHIFFLEAVRSLTEQRFADLKSAHIGGMSSVQTGPRSTAMVYLAITMAMAATNRRSQDSHLAWPREARNRWPDLRRRLGRPPMESPPLT